MANTALSPMMRQYFDIKEKHPDHILFFRLGDFYEMFFDDAKIASKELEITLTGRDCGQEERAPMCGVPHHSCESYIARLIKKGYKVAVCEQLEDPKTAKGVVKRDVIRVITPGTIVENSMLDEGSNNYIASVVLNGKSAGICFCDVSTGDLNATELLCDNEYQNLINEIGRFAPSEIIVNHSLTEAENVFDFIKSKLNSSVNIAEDSLYIDTDKQNVISKQFSGMSMEALGIENMSCVQNALFALLKYLYETQKSGIDRITQITLYSNEQYMHLDMYAKRNLELCETLRSKEKKGSLLWVLDKTKTAMGKRLMRTYIENPLTNPTVINKRLNAVQELYDSFIMRTELRELLDGFFDVERIMTRIVFGNANPRELRSMGAALDKLPEIKKNLENVKSRYLHDVYDETDTLEDVASMIDRAIVDNPPVNLKDGGFIKDGYDAQLDELRDIVKNTKKYISDIELAEKEKTGIKTLKIGYNRVFGYYIEISKAAAENAPDTYIRKQTLSNCERFITEELKILEEKLLGASEKILDIEQALYSKIRKYISEQLIRIQSTSHAVAKLDVYLSFAHVAVENRYVCPSVIYSDNIVIKGGRHPVVEQLLTNGQFVANDTVLDCNENQIAVITGPNMAGKSTYMRQTALIVLMAQMGSFVPADSVEMGVVDGIFTRVGASDDLASGESTFMVEMNEVASILKNATSRSLLILDEIGRGTSTFDGMSIAQAVIEHIANKKKLGAKTLFATHYHELTALENSFSNIKNFNIAVKKRGNDITFLRKIIPGGTDDSYGIEVSKLAGIPDSIIKRAFEILHTLECVKHEKSSDREDTLDDVYSEGFEQVSFGDTAQNAVLNDIKALDLNTLTPIEALNILSELKKAMES